MPFPCLKCGLCCRMLQHIPLLAEYDLGNGVCRYLVNNQCSIYENRPTLCNIDEMYTLYFETKITKTDFYIENLKACIAITEQFQEVSVKQKLETELRLLIEREHIIHDKKTY